MEFKTAATRGEIAFCKEVLFAFRTNLDEATYIDQILDMIQQESFKLVYIPNEDNTKAAAFTGYRTMNMLRTGPIIYIDDLYTDPQYRGKGHAGALLDYVTKEARDSGKQAVHLDSGYTLHPAHRLYLTKGYMLACHHFALKVS
jgi:GNAT superfamily N-acetyltransferase